MSNGYGYKNQVSPANTGSYPGYGYGGYGHYGYPMSPQPTPFPVQMPTNMQVQAAQMQQAPPNVPSGAFVTPAGGNIVTLPAIEESYVENILRLNRGKMATFYMTYENNREWNAKIFKGVIEAAGRDHIVISDPTTGMRYLLLTLNLDYVTFDEPIAYEYPFQGSVVSSSTPLGMATLGTVNSSR
ncbi:spore coat protein GerQ [Paenibacillus sinopodophylli]|uniref:spore coat protein GerQ n=1 Tax=Paenibacillus sinopodophylli TaxID=1837342 RepID=UPI00110CBD98|nr:spore coat protein GerQ [Paenibacillus sinopodophylli]